MTKYVKNPKCKIRKENQGFIVYIPSAGPLWFNETAMDVLNLISESSNVESIISALTSKYDNTKNVDDIRKDIEKTLTILEMTECIQKVKE